MTDTNLNIAGADPTGGWRRGCTLPPKFLRNRMKRSMSEDRFRTLILLHVHKDI